MFDNGQVGGGEKGKSWGDGNQRRLGINSVQVDSSWHLNDLKEEAVMSYEGRSQWKSKEDFRVIV